MQEDLRTLLLGLADGRVSWGARPQGTPLPAVVLNTVSETTPYTYTGASELVTARVQADIWAPSYAAAVAVDRALTALVTGYSGTVGATEFYAIFLESRFDGSEEAAPAAERVFRISRDLMVHYKDVG